MTADAVDLANISILPKAPRTFVGKFADIVVGDPIGIIVKLRGAEILLFETVASVENRLDAIVLLDDGKPLPDSALQLCYRKFSSFLHIEHGRQVASLEVHLLKEKLGLLPGINVRREKMVSAAQYIVLPGLIEILVEILIDNAHAFRSLYEDEADGLVVNRGVAQTFPVDMVLIVADVKAMNIITLRVVGLTIDSLPTERKRTDEKVIEYKKIDSHDKGKACQESP